MSLPKTILLASSAALLLSGCSREGEFDSSGGINVVRSACPAVAIPTYTGDITLFNPPSSRDSRAIDVVANITNMKKTCNEAGTEIVSNITFDVQARRSDWRGARDVVLPFFVTVVQGGKYVVSKRVGSVALRFADGQTRAQAVGSGTGSIEKAAATLPPQVLERINRKRKPGDYDAAIDPMADPEIKEMIARTSFEVLVGFQLTQDQLQYNATR